MKRISALLILGIGLLSSSCTTRQARQVLDHAEALIGNDCPDSALVVLTAFDTTDLHSRESKARYALLHTMALYKGFHDDDLTLYSIEPAARWYINCVLQKPPEETAPFT